MPVTTPQFRRLSRSAGDYSPPVATRIVQEHPELLRPRTLVKSLLEEVIVLSAYCGEAECNNLIHVTGSLKKAYKSAGHWLDNNGKERLEIIHELEALVKYLKERNARHSGRARRQLLQLKKTEAEKGQPIELITTVGPVPTVQQRAAYSEAAGLLRAALKKM